MRRNLNSAKKVNAASQHDIKLDLDVRCQKLIERGLLAAFPRVAILGEEGVQTVEDLAGCATDDLVGWTEKKQGEVTKHKGAWSDLDVSAADAEQLIMAARIAAGWIEAPAEEPSDEVQA